MEIRMMWKTNEVVRLSSTLPNDVWSMRLSKSYWIIKTHLTISLYWNLCTPFSPSSPLRRKNNNFPFHFYENQGTVILVLFPKRKKKKKKKTGPQEYLYSGELPVYVSCSSETIIILILPILQWMFLTFSVDSRVFIYNSIILILIAYSPETRGRRD